MGLKKTPGNPLNNILQNIQPEKTPTFDDTTTGFISSRGNQCSVHSFPLRVRKWLQTFGEDIKSDLASQ